MSLPTCLFISLKLLRLFKIETQILFRPYKFITMLDRPPKILLCYSNTLLMNRPNKFITMLRIQCWTGRPKIQLNNPNMLLFCARQATPCPSFRKSKRNTAQKIMKKKKENFLHRELSRLHMEFVIRLPTYTPGATSRDSTAC